MNKSARLRNFFSGLGFDELVSADLAAPVFTARCPVSGRRQLLRRPDALLEAFDEAHRLIAADGHYVPRAFVLEVA